MIRVIRDREKVENVKSKIVNPHRIANNPSESYFEDAACKYIDVINIISKLTLTKQKIIHKLADNMQISDISDELQLAKSTIYNHIYKTIKEIKKMQLEQLINSLNPEICNIAKQLYKNNKKYKIEYEDLLQQAYMEIVQIYRQVEKTSQGIANAQSYYLQAVKNNLNKYVSDWKKQKLSKAISIEELNNEKY